MGYCYALSVSQERIYGKPLLFTCQLLSLTPREIPLTILPVLRDQRLRHMIFPQVVKESHGFMRLKKCNGIMNGGGRNVGYGFTTIITTYIAKLGLTLIRAK